MAKFGALAVSCATSAGLVYLFADIDTTQADNQALAALPSPIPIATTTSAAPATTTTSTVLPTTTTVSPATTVTVAPTTVVSTTVVPTTVVPTTVGVPVVRAFNGAVIDAHYGPMQVQVQFINGTISEVAVIAYPNGDPKSVDINSRALPTLRAAVLAAKSAHIDTVSGATYTSDAYRISLQSAIDQARAAGVTSIA